MSAAEATRDELAWLEGIFIPQASLAIPVGDAGFVSGVTVTEQFRTFRGKLFLPEDHGRRLAGSLALVGIDSPWCVEELLAAAAEVAAHNHRLATHGQDPATTDLGLVIFATPGDLAAQHGGQAGSPRVAIHTFPLAYSMWAAAYDTGVALRTVAVTQVPETCWSLDAKVRSRLHYHLADRAAHAREPGARAVLRHADGRISETSTANVAIVRGDTILTPPRGDALGGVSLAHTKQLATELGYAWHEQSLTAAECADADEILLTSTPSCILPATRFDGAPVGSGMPGGVYRSILDAWSREVGLDIAAQARGGVVVPPSP